MRWAVAAGLLDRDDLVEDLEVAAGEEGAAVDDHVDLVGAGGDGVPGVGELDRQAGPAARERGRDAGDVDAAAAQRLDGDRDHVGVDADRGDLRGGRVGRVGPQRLGAQRADLARGVLPLQRGEVDHRDRQVDRPRLGRGLDRPGAERGGAGLGADLVDAGQAVQEPAQRGVGGRDVGDVRAGRGARDRRRSGRCHRPSLAPARAARQPPVRA